MQTEQRVSVRCQQDSVGDYSQAPSREFQGKKAETEKCYTMVAL
jgi:hypothetical protein